MSKKLNRAAVVRRKRKEIMNLIDDTQWRKDMLYEDESGSEYPREIDKKKEKKFNKKIKSLKVMLKNLSGKGGGGMLSPTQPLKDQSLLSMAKKRQM
jgi:hypothetical protein